MNFALLDRLRRAGEFVAWSDLAESDRATMERDLADLSRVGFAIESDPARGVCLRETASRLCAGWIEWQLGTQTVGRRVVVRSRVGSTNDEAAQAGSSRSNAGLAVFAEEQTAGRGRRGRVWSAPTGSSLLVSILLFPPEGVDDPGILTALGAVAVAEVVGPSARIKWPNDVRVIGRKVAGILVERGVGTVVGIGLNVNVAAEELPEDVRDLATSLQILRGEPCDRSEVARDLLRRLDEWYESCVRDGSAPLLRAWRDRSEHRDQLVRVETPAGRRVGRVVDLDPTRGLDLVDPTGEIVRIAARDVQGITSVDPARVVPQVGPGG